MVYADEYNTDQLGKFDPSARAHGRGSIYEKVQSDAIGRVNAEEQGRKESGLLTWKEMV